MRVPDSKSMPKLMPSPAIASAPITRITPEAEKNHFDLPMKSNFQPPPSPLLAPIAKPRFMIRVRLIAPRMAEVASTAVKSEMIVPTPSVKAKPARPPSRA